MTVFGGRKSFSTRPCKFRAPNERLSSISNVRLIRLFGGRSKRCCSKTAVPPDSSKPPWVANDRPPMRPLLWQALRIGPYEILGVLGVGGMGEVYRAQDTNLNRVVALKVLPRAFASNPDRVRRLRREAKFLGSLNHPHIAGIYAVEESSRGSR